MQDIKQKFWFRVKEIRKKEWLSQEDLAFKAKLHRTYISDIERGNKNISIENIYKIAQALGIEVYNLFK